MHAKQITDTLHPKFRAGEASEEIGREGEVDQLDFAIHRQLAEYGN